MRPGQLADGRGVLEQGGILRQRGLIGGHLRCAYSRPGLCLEAGWSTPTSWGFLHWQPFRMQKWMKAEPRSDTQEKQAGVAAETCEAEWQVISVFRAFDSRPQTAHE